MGVCKVARRGEALLREEGAVGTESGRGGDETWQGREGRWAGALSGLWGGEGLEEVAWRQNTLGGSRRVHIINSLQ